MTARQRGDVSERRESESVRERDERNPKLGNDDDEPQKKTLLLTMKKKSHKTVLSPAKF